MQLGLLSWLLLLLLSLLSLRLLPLLVHLACARRIVSVVPLIRVRVICSLCIVIPLTGAGPGSVLLLR